MACPGCLDGCAVDHFYPLDDQPVSTETTVDGVFTRTFVLDQAGLMVPQHAHATDHVTVLVRGSVRVWIEGKLQGDAKAPIGLSIPANVRHHFLTLEPTTLLCVHDVSQGAPVYTHLNVLP